MSRVSGGMPDRRDRFDALFDAHSRPVLAYALRRTREPADAEDVAAETFAIAWRRIDDVPAGVAALPWLYGVARRVLANHRRGNERRGNLLARLFDRAPLVGDGPDLEDGGPLTSTLAHLRPDDRELLQLVAWEDLDHTAIAVTLGISVNAVAIRLHRARRRFAEIHAGLAADGPPDLKGNVADRTSTSMKGGAASRPGRERTR